MAGRKPPAARRIKLLVVSPLGREPGTVDAVCPDCGTPGFRAIFGGEPGWGAPSISEKEARGFVVEMVKEHAALASCKVVF